MLRVCVYTYIHMHLLGVRGGEEELVPVGRVDHTGPDPDTDRHTHQHTHAHRHRHIQTDTDTRAVCACLYYTHLLGVDVGEEELVPIGRIDHRGPVRRREHAGRAVRAD